MAFEEAERGITAQAAGSIKTSRFCKVATATDNRYLQCGANEPIVGVTTDATHDQDSANAADSGDHFRMLVGGIVKVRAGATIANGQYVKSNATGSAVPIGATASDGPQNYAGIAVSAAGAVGVLVQVLFNPGVRLSGT